MPTWYIKGEAGKALDATLRTLETLRVSSCVLKFQSLASDTLAWTAAADNATGTGTIVPEVGQVVELWLDSVRKFKGWAVMPRIGMNSVAVTVEGPWWWMSRIMLTQDQTDAVGSNVERPSMILAGATPTSYLGLSANIATIIGRAITNGCPFALDTNKIATTYDVPRITLANMDCGSALAELMRWVPDAVAWFDYTAASSATVPTLNISRRRGMAGDGGSNLSIGSMTATDYTVGTDAVESIDIFPRLDLQVSQSKLAYVTRQAVTGKPQYVSQESGSFEAGKRQMISISGPEVVDYLPPGALATATAWTVDAMYNNLVIFKTPVLAAIQQKYGSCLGGIGSVVTRWADAGSTRYSYDTNFPSLSYGLSTAGKYLCVPSASDQWPDWAFTQLGAVRIICSGTWIASELQNASGWSQRYKDHQVGATLLSGWADQQETQFYYWAAMPFSFETIWIPTRFNVSTTVYKTSDFTYATPPVGLAANLLAAQNFVPYEGTITLVGDACTGDNSVNKLVNLKSALTPFATMAAMTRGVTHDLMRGRTTLDLGTPARTDYGSLVSRIRRDPKDSIIPI